MNTQGLFKNAVPVLVLLAAAADSQGALTDLAESPLVTSGSTAVRPNLMYVLDDSGSMDRDFMPDWASSTTDYLFRNSDYNSIAYNPALTYTPPVKFKADGTVDATAYPSQTAANTAGWTNVKFDGYGVQPLFSTFHEGCPNGSTTGLACDLVIFPQFGPRYYLFQAGEYCTTKELTVCRKQDAPDPMPGGTYLYPAPLRWCTSLLVAGRATPADYACRAARIESGGTSANVFAAERHPSPNILTLNFSGSSLTSVTGLKIGTTPIIGASTAASNNPKTVAGRLVDQINLLTTATGYDATCAGGSPPTCASGAVNITAYVAGLTSTSDVQLVQTGTMTVTSTLAISNVPGKVVRVDILPTNNSYPYPGSTTKAVTRTDCAGATCTYDEEMTNYANWWAYYHTRMQMMKSSSSLAFAPIDSLFRIGYLSINNGTGSDFFNIKDFDNTNKKAWYEKFLAAKPLASTPLRTALTTAGRIYGGKLNGTALNGSAVVDPVQYSCQQNFTLLSTDGYWNEDDPGGYQLDGTTAIGNQDGTEVLPMKDGLNVSNTLADVAQYYFKTDLRPAGGGTICTGTAVPPAITGSQLCPDSAPDTLNDVPVNTTDTANWQHMTTYTLGLGASGYMRFDPSYETGESADFKAVKDEMLANPANGVCSWQAAGSGACKWPRATRDKQSAVDDLWHASINGRGAYFNARNPADLVAGLTDTLQTLTRKLGAAAAAVTSNPNITASDNLVFSTTFTTAEWSGQLIRQRLDPATGRAPDYDPNQPPGVFGTLSYNYDWTAQGTLDARPWAGRVIKTFDPAAPVGSTRTKGFEWSVLSAAERIYFSLDTISSLGTPIPAEPLSQFCIAGIGCLNSASQTAAAGEKLVNFLRGDRSQEGSRTDASKYFRQREHVLGDIVNAETVYVGKPLFSYFDPGYKDTLVGGTSVPGFASLRASRNGTVYVAANDGMLHAFDGRDEASGGGTELWAYIPGLVLPKLYKLADKNYSAQHEFLVDATPVVFDVCPSPPCAAGDWRTILVGGLGRGGRGYYALDVTVPGTEPKVLWEFTDPNMGYSYGNPIVTKDKNGTWVAVLSSGYNNVPDSNPYHATADGKGRLYVLNAYTGELLKTITTPVGTVASPSGLSSLNFWLDDWERDNTAKGIYGGDLLGNLWRFDINASSGGYQLLATFKDEVGNPQPITAKPELGEINGRRVIFAGTGRLLGITDLADTSQQSFYAVKDPLTTTLTPDTALYPNPRSDTCSAAATADCFVQQVETIGTCPASTPPNPLCAAGETVRTSTDNAVNFSTGNGWFLDLPESGERANTDPALVYGTLGFSTNVPNSVPCTSGGYSNLYLLDYRTGGPLWGGTTNNVSSIRLGDALASRPVTVALPNNKIVGIIQLSDGTKIPEPWPPTPASNAAQRSSWRELIEE